MHDPFSKILGARPPGSTPLALPIGLYYSAMLCYVFLFSAYLVYTFTQEPKVRNCDFRGQRVFRKNFRLAIARHDPHIYFRFNLYTFQKTAY